MITPIPTVGPKLPLALWISAAIVLVVAVLPLPYGYYTFTRIATCLACGILAWPCFASRPPAPIWGILFVGIAILFNPLIPIYLKRQTWFWIDLACASIILAHMVFVRGLHGQDSET
jgi:peptidoglycan/LPS O-acetylase OafA/YrhL